MAADQSPHPLSQAVQTSTPDTAPDTAPHTAPETVDVVIIGAGLSGIGAAVHLKATVPDCRYVILEGRDAIGGTWDLFRYPGIRSDSDMYTLGYAFRPWEDARAIADGPSILRYVRDTARAHDVERHIRFGHRVVAADWSTPDALWTLQTRRASDDAPVVVRARHVMLCAGYYRYDRAHVPDFPGRERFRGAFVVPQFWPEGLDHAGRRVVVIGSGATAVTIVPEMARTAAHVTMLQRSPTWMFARPDTDPLANGLRRILPSRLAYAATRWKNVTLGRYFYRRARSQPDRARAFLLDGIRKVLPPNADIADFTPRYDPWDQRICLVPNADLFTAIGQGRAEVVTDTIETFTETGIRLSSGRELAADIIVSATGLMLQPTGGVALSVDGHAVDVGQTFSYKGMMYSGLPNLVSVFGYTNASWTLKADLSCAWFARLIAHQRRRGLRQAMPVAPAGLEAEPYLDFTSGYVQRAMHLFPKQGKTAPWRLHQDWFRDRKALRREPIEDGTLLLSNPPPLVS
jgi:cation diffusion facilitator CzcD-associated flavoprotein CzcO